MAKYPGLAHQHVDTRPPPHVVPYNRCIPNRTKSDKEQAVLQRKHGPPVSALHALESATETISPYDSELNTPPPPVRPSQLHLCSIISEQQVKNFMLRRSRLMHHTRTKDGATPSLSSLPLTTTMPKATRKSQRKVGAADGRATQSRITPLYEATEVNVGCPICPIAGSAPLHAPFELSVHMLTRHTVKKGSHLYLCGWLGCTQTAPMSSSNLLDHYNRHTGGRHTCGYPIPDPDNPTDIIECEELCKDRRSLCEHRGQMHQNWRKASSAVAEGSTSTGSGAQASPAKRSTERKRAPYKPREKHSKRKASHKPPVPAPAARRRESPLPDAHFIRRVARIGLQSPALVCAAPLSRRSSNSTLYDGGAQVTWSGKTRLRDEIAFLSDGDNDDEEGQHTAAEQDEGSVGDGYHSEDEVDELLSSDSDPLQMDDLNDPRHGNSKERGDTDALMRLQDMEDERGSAHKSYDHGYSKTSRRKEKSAALDLRFDDATPELPSLEENWKSF